MNVTVSGELKKKNILVAGGTGLVGTNLTARLLGLEANVLSTCYSRKPWIHDEVYRQYDFTKYGDCLEATKDKDYVIICAAYSLGIKAMKVDPSGTIFNNLRIISGLLEAAKVNKAEKIIFISSSTVYPLKDSPLTEADLDLNTPPYESYLGIGWMNRYIEKLCFFYYKQYGIKIGIVRPTNIYGPYDKLDAERCNVLPALIMRAIKKENPFIIWGNGSVVRDFIYVEDFIDALLNVLENYCVCEPLNLSSGNGVRISDAVRLILDFCGHKINPEYDLSKPQAIPYRVLSSGKYESIYGKRKLVSFEEGVSRTVEWYKSIGVN